MRYWLFLVSLTISFSTLSQVFTDDNYYSFPINPGQQSFLAGTMGELRSSHFHAGIDVKTGGKTGLPVRATADGYIWRVKISPYGYGKALYMRHPNGTTSVYAHLNKLNDELDNYITSVQYSKESYSVEMFPQKSDFMYKKGEIIAFSGNSGSSSGPHLHFEIRDINQRALDPLRFDFPEIIDDMTPVIKKIAFNTLSEDARVNDMFGRFEFDIIKVQGKYTTRTPIVLKGSIGIEIYAYDLMNGVWNKNGIPEMVCRINGDTIYHHKKNSLSFAKQRNILAHYNYQAYKNGRPKFDKLYLDDGNTQDFYLKTNKGYVFNDTIHKIEIFLSDSYRNISSFDTNVNHRKVVNRPELWFDKIQFHRDFLHFKSDQNQPIELFFGNKKEVLSPYYSSKKSSYYVWDMRKGLPDSINYFGETIIPNIKALIPSGKEYNYAFENIDVKFKKSTLFDSLYLQYERTYDSLNNRELYKFNHDDFALKSSAKITIKPLFSYVDSISSVYSVYKNKLNNVDSKWINDDEVVFKTRELLTYTIASDSIPPTIQVLSANSKTLQFRIADTLSGIKKFRAEINGKFVLMEYDAKRKLITSKAFPENIPFRGEFLLQVNDKVGNKVEFKKTL